MKAVAWDGSQAVASVEIRLSDAACAYPITPTTRMAEAYQRAAAQGARTLWDIPLSFVVSESEHSAASVCEGYALAGGRVTTFTAGQGLILMKEVLYTIAGKRLPMVFHVGARAISSQALNVHAGHDDIFGVLDTGWGVLFAGNPQEAHDFTLIARAVSESTSVPYFCVQDGFYTTHTVERVEALPDALLKDWIAPTPFPDGALFDPARPLMTGSVQNQDFYMEGRLAQRAARETARPALEAAFARLGRETGRHYAQVMMSGSSSATLAFVGVGSAMGTARAAARALTAEGIATSVIDLKTLRPFPDSALARALRGCTQVIVLERTDQPLAADNPLTLEVKSALYQAGQTTGANPEISTAVYGLGGRDLGVGDLIAAGRLAQRTHPVFMTLNARDGRSPATVDVADQGLSPGACVIQGRSIGGYGSIATNRFMASVLLELLGWPVQAYPWHGSEKKGLPTRYTLVCAPLPIDTHAEPRRADILLAQDRASTRAELLSCVRPGGILIDADPPRDATQTVAVSDPTVRVIPIDIATCADAALLPPEWRLRGRGMLMAGALVYALSERLPLPKDAALFVALDRLVARAFAKSGDAIVAMNGRALRAGYAAARRADAPAQARASGE